MASVQLLRLASVKTAARLTSSTSQSTESATTANALGNHRRRSQDRASPSSSHQGGEEDATVRIEVFAHGAIGKEAVLVASLSNSVLLVMRIGGSGEGVGGEGNGLRSWLLDWPVSGKIRGLCVSPDLQCVLCVTENLEGVYILAVDNLGAQDAAQPTAPTPNDDEPDGRNSKNATGGGGGGGGTPEGGLGGRRSSVAAVAGATTVRPPPRSVAATAFPSLLHLASRGQRKRSGGAVAYPSAEPVFIASLARRGGDGERRGEQGDGGRNALRQSSGSDGRGSSAGAGRRASRNVRANVQFECLWWAARNGDHFAIIGGPGGEVHFLDLERLDAWVVNPPPPAMARGRVCALTITADLTATRRSSQGAAGGGKEDSTSSPNNAAEKVAAEKENSDPPRHLVAVLEKGAVFVVLLESRCPGGGIGGGGGGGISGNGNGSGVEGGPDGGITGEGGGEGGVNTEAAEGVLGPGDSDDGGRGRQHSKYIRAGADRTDQAEFAPSWLDVGRGGGGGGGGGMSVRAVPPVGASGRSPAVDGSSGGGGDACRRMRMSIISRAWGSKCSVKILRVATMPDAKGGADKHRQWSGGKQHALRTETVRQITLPVDHASPEQHGLAAIDGTWAVLASSPAGGTPARITVAPLGAPERPVAHPIRVFTLPHGEHVGGVTLLSGSNAASADHASTSAPAGAAAEENGDAGPWGLVWSECCIYRVDLGGTQQARPKTEGAGRSDQPQAPKSLSPRPRPRPHLLPSPPQHLLSGVTAASGATIALRRPSAASVRRARELHASGRLGEAAQVAIEALDGHTSSAATSRGARSRSLGEEETAGGGVTTRMVREDLANSLLEWLVMLQGRQLRASPRGAVSGVPGSAGDEGTSGAKGGGSMQAPERNFSAKKGADRPRSASQGNGTGAPRESKATPCPRMPSKSELTRDVVASKARASASVASPQAAPPPPLLERYLLASRDYDPVLAATLLHAHGEADLAVVAGTARGKMALRGVLRVLAESIWPPRLGLRAVEALCLDETGMAPREVVIAGEGTLFAALEPRLQLRILLSEKSILFGGCDGGDPAAAAAAAAAGGAATSLVGGIPLGDSEADLVGATVGEAIAGVSSHLGPILFALSVEDLSGLISRLAQWCKDDAASLVEKLEEAAKVFPAKKVDTARHGRGGDSARSAASVEAVEMILRALCELSGREPPSGEHHRRAWLCAGCLGSVHEGGDSLLRPVTQARVGDTMVAVASATEGGIGRANLGDTALARAGGRGALGAPVLEWARFTTLLCDILVDEGASSGWASEVDGGLPTAARLRLLRVLPAVWGWHEPVRLMMRLRGAGCWAAVALELELSMNRPEAASAMLHGVVHLLQDGEGVTPGEAARILNGKGLHRPPPPPPSQSETLPTVSNTEDTGQSAATATGDLKSAASEVMLRIVDTHVFRRGSDGAGDCDSASTAAPSTAGAEAVPRAATLSAVAATAPAAPHVILARASILAQALCVWGQFGLPRAPLEAFLRPRLHNRDDARVLAAVFFPQLSLDMIRTTGHGRDKEEAAVATAVEGVGTGYTLGELVASAGVGRAEAVSARPTVAQIEAARKLGLSPRFTLALLRVAEKPHPLPGFISPPRNTDGVGGASRGGQRPPEPASSSATTSQPVSSSGASLPPGFPARNDGMGPNTLAPSTLALLLEDRAGGGRQRGRVGVTMSGVGGASPGSGLSALQPPGARGQPVSWSEAVAGGRASGAAAAAASDEHADGVWFSCGHRFSRDHLLRTVVPTCLSTVSQATSSLQRTRQILTQEYEGRRAGAACPECAATELGRLVAGLRPAAAAAAALRVVEGGISNESSPPPPAPAPPAPPLSPSPRPRRLPNEERTRVW